MTAFPADGYSSALTKIETNRDAEARILSRLNSNLVRSMSRMLQDFPAFINALHDNDRFWTQLATDLSGDGNRLPVELRGALISIAGFVIRHSTQVRQGAVSAQPLVDVNASIIRGLTQTEGQT